ncbi:MAG TPA: hypothetical protein VKE98_03135 [Gemmataceae bacterium]|nr:hypothetical protein [Gemmataceae bacterium]
MRTALRTLPWVEQSSIQTDVASREVRFNLKDRKDWSEAAVKKALNDQRFPEVTVKTAPK